MMGALIGLMITAGLVVAVFSLLPHAVLQGEWPLNISASEVMKYAEVADVRRVEQQLKEPQGEAYIIGASQGSGECLYDQHGSQWEWRWFEAPGFGDSVQVRPSTTIDGGYELRFKELAPFRGQDGIIISPARPEDIRLKYAEVLATKLGLATPAISFVRVVACGKEQRTHLVEETIGEGFLGRRRFNEAILFKDSFDPDRPDRIFPEVIGDTAHSSILRSMLALLNEDAEAGRLDRMAHAVDDRALAGWMLMHWLEGSPEPLKQENYFAFQWNRGRTTPLHRASRDHASIDTLTSDEIGANVFTPWVKVQSFQATFNNVRNELLADRAGIEEAFAAVDTTWLPVLANDAPSAEVKAIADRIKQEMFTRLEQGDALAFFDRPMVKPAGYATLMKGQEVAKRYWPTESDIDVVRAIAEKYKGRIHGDSIVFPRGKYFIDEDIILPKGYGLILLSGARITMAPDRNILVQGPLHIRGSRLNPVFIRPGGGAFGTIAVFGDGETKCTVNGLQISGGRGARINGVQHPAMLSIQDVASTHSSDCIFSAPAGELAMFVQGGSFTMEENVMLASALEVRDVAGRIVKSNFQNVRGGAALSINASRLQVEESSFILNTGTAIAAMDGSKVLVRGSQVNNCGLAILAADLAEVHVLENSISGNRTAFSAKRTKPAYGGAKIFVYSNDLQRNGNERDADEHSTISDAERFDERVMQDQVQ